MLFSKVPEMASNYAEFANPAGRSLQRRIGELQFPYAIFAIPLVFLGRKITPKNAKKCGEMVDFVTWSCQFGSSLQKSRHVTCSVSGESVLSTKKPKNEEKYASMRI